MEQQGNSHEDNTFVKDLEQTRVQKAPVLSTEMEITWRVINRGLGGGEWGGKVQRISSINDR